MLVTIHPQMVDVASMSQFLLMTSDLMSVIEEAGGRLDHDFIRYVITRHDPNDVPKPKSWPSFVTCSIGCPPGHCVEIDRNRQCRSHQAIAL